MSKLAQLRSGGAAALDKHLHETVARRHVPGVFYLATNAKETIYANQEGEVVFGDEKSGQIDADTTMELFSQTKLVTCLCALQLVDRGLVKLDSEEDVAKHLPEIAKIPVLRGYSDDGEAILTPAEKKVTLRMLMSHTAGFVYAFTESVLSRYMATHPAKSIFDPEADVTTISQPLVFEPGTSWIYSTSIDWAGLLVERVSGLRLDKYMQQNIFDPLGLKSLSFFPTPEIKAKKMALCVRNEKGVPTPTSTGFGMERPTDPEKVSTKLLLGGAGLFGTQRDYLVILRAILQSDPSSPHKSDKPLLSPESFKQLFTGCVAPDGKQGMVNQVGRPNYFDPPVSTSNVDHSVGFLLNLEDFTGRRKKGSGCWSGAAKTQFWVDPTTGIAGICATQLLSPAPDPWFQTYCDYERELYANLE